MGRAEPMTPGFFWIIAQRADKEHLESLGVEILSDTLEGRPESITTYMTYMSEETLRKLSPFWHRYYWGRETIEVAQ